MSADIVQELLQPVAYSHPVAEVQLRETHISWVFLTGSLAYKVKKPRNLGFLDFSTLAARKHFCEEELRLNRRFAPDLYLAVVPITRDGGLHIDGDGELVDYAVKMRQFDDTALLSTSARVEGLPPATTRELARLLAQTHASLPSLFPDGGAGTPLVMQDAMQDNFARICAYPLGKKKLRQLATLQAWSTERLAGLLPTMVRRIATGHVKECHGDLHLGNIARIDERLVFFDCIEFNDEFRIMDTMAELAFLAMDCQARGLGREAQRLINDYLEYSGDYEGLVVLDWYRCYYALVRAKVNLLRLDMQDPNWQNAPPYEEFLRYLQLALGYKKPPANFLAITYGVSGSGKSTVAMQLLERSNAIRIRSDVERKRLFQLAPESRSDPAVHTDIYSEQVSASTFARLQGLAQLIVQSGFSCIVDATFLRSKQRKPFASLAHYVRVPFIILHCRASTANLRRRITERNAQGEDASEADVAVMERQKAANEALNEQERLAALEIGEATSVKTILRYVARKIKEYSRNIAP